VKLESDSEITFSCVNGAYLGNLALSSVSAVNKLDSYIVMFCFDYLLAQRKVYTEDEKNIYPRKLGYMGEEKNIRHY
jgi:hypothetical protein